MNKTNLSEEAYLALKKKLSELESGAHLSIRTFAKEANMGYTPVREAFLRLAREGMLRQIPNVGFFVETYDIMAIFHYYQVRECLEPFVLRNVFTHLTPDDIKVMEREVKKCETAIGNNDTRSFIAHDIAFHSVIFERYNNPHLLQLYKSVREQNMYVSQQNLAISSYALSDHQELLASIKAQDLAIALNVLNKHIANAKINVLEGDHARY